MPQLLHYLNVDADTNMVALPQRQGEQGSEQNQASTVSPTPSTTPFSNKTHEVVYMVQRTSNDVYGGIFSHTDTIARIGYVSYVKKHDINHSNFGITCCNMFVW